MKEKHKKRMFDILSKKIQHMHGDVWGGYFTPVEVLLLIDNGVMAVRSDDIYDRMIESKRKGDCQPVWFYFILGEFKKFVPNPTPNKNGIELKKKLD